MSSDSALLRRARGAPAADNAGPAPRILPLAAALIPRPPLFCASLFFFFPMKLCNTYVAKERHKKGLES